MAEEYARDLPPLTEAEYAAGLPRRMQEIADDLTAVLPDSAQDAGLHFEWASLSDPPPAETGPEPLLIRKPSAIFQVPQVLLEDSGMGDITDWIGKVMRGEIEPPPRREPKRHRCLACWLLSLLPGHDRCSHGYLESGCETCGE